MILKVGEAAAAETGDEEESPDSHEAWRAALWILLTKASVRNFTSIFLPLFWTGGHLMFEITLGLLCRLEKPCYYCTKSDFLHIVERGRSNQKDKNTKRQKDKKTKRQKDNISQNVCNCEIL